MEIISSSTIQKRPIHTFFGVTWHSILVGAAYSGIVALTNMRGADTQSLVWSFAGGGIVIGVTLGLMASRMPTSPIQRSWFSWLWRFALSYIVFYYFFGAINYLLVTGPYYEAHTGGLVSPPQEVILKAELIRAALIVLSIVPFLLAFRASKKRMAFLAGLILFAVGGLAPLLMQVRGLPLVLLAASAVEIFFQNYSTGVVSLYLLGRPEGA